MIILLQLLVLALTVCFYGAVVIGMTALVELFTLDPLPIAIARRLRRARRDFPRAKVLR
jgi:hypothetical protein